jgi:hypothetical protein
VSGLIGPAPATQSGLRASLLSEGEKEPSTAGFPKLAFGLTLPIWGLPDCPNFRMSPAVFANIPVFGWRLGSIVTAARGWQ